MAEVADPRSRRLESLADSAYHALRNRIIQGLLSPETPLLEEQISSLLGMSRTPVRTAMTRLHSEGLLVAGADRTLRVPGLDGKTMTDTLQARMTIETETAALAAENATAEQLLRLDNLIWNEERAHENRDDALTAGLDRMFHIYIAEVADNVFFKDFVARVVARASLFLALSGTLGDAIIPALSEHRAILQAISNHDPEQARAAMRNHLLQVESRMVKPPITQESGA